MDPRKSAAALGTGAVVVVAAGLGVTIARSADDGAVESTAATSHASPSPTAVAPSTSPPVVTTSAPVHGDRHHSDVPGAGRTGSGHGPNRQPTPGPTHLPFTGSAPLPATTALGLLLAVAGTWTLVRLPSTPGEAPVVIAMGALDRLRAPRRAAS